MEKNRIHPITNGKGFRMSYARQKEVLEMPNLIEVQRDSYQWFLDEGLREAFADISPITDYSGKLSLVTAVCSPSTQASGQEDDCKFKTSLVSIASSSSSRTSQ